MRKTMTIGDIIAVREFVAERMEVDSKALTLGKDIYNAYCHWAKSLGGRPAAIVAFYAMLYSRGFQRGPSAKPSGRATFEGLRIRDLAP